MKSLNSYGTSTYQDINKPPQKKEDKQEDNNKKSN